MTEMHDLIASHLHGDASPEEVKRLFEWLQSSPANADEFARATMLHTQLREQLAGERQARISGEVSIIALPDSQRERPLRQLPRSWHSARMIAVSAVCVLIAAILWVSQYRKDTHEVVNTPADIADIAAFATIAQAVDVNWNETATFRPGDRTAAATFELKSGFVQLKLDSGVEVTLEGPVHFELVSVDYAKFHSGLLTSTVPPGAEGFRIDTPTAQVVDLGTAFGIELSKDGASRVSVFDGQVEVGLMETGTKQLLTEGEAVHVDDRQAIESIPFDASAYDKIWPISSGISGSSGAFRFAPPWPRRLRLVRSDTDIFVIPEGYARTLENELHVNVSSPGKYVRESELTPGSLAVGQSGRSFILHYHPEQARRPRRAERISGSITFDQPVLGLILLHEELSASAGTFSPRNAGEAHERRQIELSGGRMGDEITLSPDRRTVTLNLASPNYTSDLVRVIVDAPIPIRTDHD